MDLWSRRRRPLEHSDATPTLGQHFFSFMAFAFVYCPMAPAPGQSAGSPLFKQVLFGPAVNLLSLEQFFAFFAFVLAGPLR